MLRGLYTSRHLQTTDKIVPPFRSPLYPYYRTKLSVPWMKMHNSWYVPQSFFGIEVSGRVAIYGWDHAILSCGLKYCYHFILIFNWSH